MIHDLQDVEPALDKILQDLRTDYLDLSSVLCIHCYKLTAITKSHWPITFKHTPRNNFSTHKITGLIALVDTPIASTWVAMETLVEKGEIWSIGVSSNFTKEKIEELLKT
jgi:diketogulonate reductase-like aldo/keto reductase